MTTDELQIQITADTGNASQNINETANALNKLDNSAKTADDGMSQLVKAMSDAALNMVSVSQNIAQSAAGMSDYKASFDNLSATLTNFSARLESVNALTAGTSFDGAAASVQALSAASESSAAALSGIVTATDGFNERMDALSDTTHGTTTGMVNLQKEIVSAVAEIRGFADNLGTAGQDAATTSQKIRELSEDVQKLVKSSQAGGAAAVSLAAGFSKLKGIIATLGVGKFIKDSNDAYNVQMQNELKLTAHMKHRMNATDDEIQSIKDLASAQQKIGVIGDEIQLAGAQQLTTYAKQSSTLKTLIPAMNNLIAQNAGYDATAGDATSAADMLGRALNGQYTSLKRMGVMFSEAQENVLKYGTEEQKAAVLADAISSRVGNMNELLSQTPTGQLKQLQNDFGDLQEQLGATFQPLISAVLPIVRGALETLVPPVMNFSRGIVTIGSAIASIDSPATRGIALAAAGIAVMNKLKLAIGGTSAGLLLLGVILTGIIGGMQEQQDDIGATVKNAMDSAENATGKASEAVSDYNEQLNNTEKTINRLAGFDTITKLSGGSSSGGALVNALLGDNGIGDIQAATLEVGDLQAALDSVNATDVNLSFDNVISNIAEVGESFKKAFSVNPDEQLEGLRELDQKLERYLGELYTKTFRPIGVSLGEGLYHGIQAAGKITEGDIVAASKEAVIAQSKLAQLNPFLTEDQREAANRLESDIVNGSSQTAYDLDKALIQPQQNALQTTVDFMNGVRDKQIDILQTILGQGFDISWMHDVTDEIDNAYISAGSWLYDTQTSSLKAAALDMSKYSVTDFNYAIIDALKSGLMPTDALEAAKSNYLTTADMRDWFDKYVTVDMSTISQWRENLISSGQISSGSYRDVPLQPSAIPSNVPTDQIAPRVSVYINNEEQEASYVSVTNGKGS